MCLRACILSLLLVSGVWAEDCCSLSGHIATEIRDSSSKALDDGSVLQQDVEASYKDVQNNFQAHLDLHYQLEDGEVGSQLNQLSVEKQVDNLSFRLGRMTRSDSLGFYSLDGVLLSRTKSLHSLQASLGIPRKIDHYQSVHIDRLFGAAWRYSAKPNTVALWNRHSLYLSTIGLQLQHLRDSDNASSQSRLGFSLAGGQVTVSKAQRARVQMQADLDIDHGYLYKANFAVDMPVTNAKNLLRTEISTFKPQKEVLDFQQRFYQLYSHGKQSRLQSSYFYRIDYQKQAMFTLRYVERENASSGIGSNLTLLTRHKDGLKQELRFDALHMNNDSVLTLYARRSSSLNALLRYRAGFALQQMQGNSNENNRALVVEYKLEYMPSIESYLSVYLKGSLNNRKANDLFVSLKYAWYFDKAAKRLQQ